MASKKLYNIIINDGAQRGHKYVYSYGSIKDISIKVASKGVTISFYSGAKYDLDTIRINKPSIFADMLKKVSLLYLLKESSSLNIKRISMGIDGNFKEIYNGKEEDDLIYSMIKGKLERPFNFVDEDQIISSILNYTKEKLDAKIACIYNLLISKSKTNRTERFMYLWMAFNSFYNAIIEKNIPEYQELQIMEILIGAREKEEINKNDVTNKEKRRIEYIASTKIAQNIDFKVNKEYVLNNPLGLDKYLENVYYPQDKLSEYGYLLVQFAYQYRCKLFHGNKPNFLFAYKDDANLKALNLINDLLEEFLDNNYVKLFNEEYTEMLNKTNEIISKFNKAEKERKKKEKQTK